MQLPLSLLKIKLRAHSKKMAKVVIALKVNAKQFSKLITLECRVGH